jgi:tetratricopeptide (TPR) repeat protein
VAGAACLRLGDLEGAEDAIREALDIATALKMREKLPSLVSRKMRWHLERGEPEEAIAAGKPFLDGGGAGVERLGAAELRLEMGRAYRELGPDWADRTEKHILGALAEFEGMGSPHNEAAARTEIALYWRLLGEEEEGEAQFDRAAETFRSLGAPRRAAEVEALRRSA